MAFIWINQGYHGPQAGASIGIEPGFALTYRNRTAITVMNIQQLSGAAFGCRPFHLFLALFLVVLTGACAQTRSAGPEASIARPSGGLAVLLMPADVEISLLTTGGIEEPNAEWTEQGRRNVVAALKAEMAERSIEVVSYGDDSNAGYQIALEHEQLVKLHEAVGGAIMIHKYVAGLELPTKKDRFDWTLGNGVRDLRGGRDTGYALFVYAEDSFSSAGRAAMKIALAVLGAHVEGGRQVAFASLVDLENGDVVWFNVLTSTVGDLRDPVQARQAMSQLLESSPL